MYGQFRVIDADGHVMEPDALYDDYLDPGFRPQLAALREAARARPMQTFFGLLHTIRSGRPLGAVEPYEPIVRTAGFLEVPKGGWDPRTRLADMDAEGIDVAVVFPTGVSSFCALDDPAFESAMYEAYARWVGEYCLAAPDRLRAVAVVNMRDPVQGAREIRRWGREAWCVGIYCSGHIDGKLLDHPDLFPLWDAAQGEDLPICFHGGTARPPYGCGTFEFAESFFLMHAATNPFEQMRALGALIGGGVLERFPRLRVAFLEAGVGWVPFWLDRLDEHYERLPAYAPLLSRAPSAHVRGPQVFVSCDPDESTLPVCVEALGAERILYASDYPHFDSRFPNTAKLIAERPELSEEAKRKILGENARRLYPRLGG